MQTNSMKYFTKCYLNLFWSYRYGISCFWKSTDRQAEYKAYLPHVYCRHFYNLVSRNISRRLADWSWNTLYKIHCHIIIMGRIFSFGILYNYYTTISPQKLKFSKLKEAVCRQNYFTLQNFLITCFSHRLPYSLPR